MRTFEIKKIPKPIFKNLFKRWIILGGCGREVIFTIENTSEPVYLIFYYDRTICFNKHKFRVVIGGECPLDVTCGESVKRHGKFEMPPSFIINPGENGLPTLEEFVCLSDRYN